MYAPALSGMITALHMSEIGGNQSMFFFSLCCKSHFEWEVMSEMISIKFAEKRLSIIILNYWKNYKNIKYLLLNPGFD